MAITIRRHLDRGMAKAALHQLERQLEATIDAAVDAPAGIEMAQGMEARIFCLPMLVGDAGRDLDRGFVDIWS
jgi:hypothetical protein